MRLTRYRGLLVVAAWQLAPVTVQQDATGKVQVVMGYGAGRYEEVITSCEGDVLEEAKIPFGGGGIAVDYLPSEQVRLTGYGGAVSNDPPASFDPWDGAYFGTQMALEGRVLGIGGGPTRWPDGEVLPNAYFRLGTREEMHLRIDVLSPSPPLGATGSMRLGFGYNDGIRRAFRVFGGLAPCTAACVQSSGGVFLEVGMPLTSTLDLEAGAMMGDDPGQHAFAARLRLHLGREE